ncbi:MAG TPA: ankyrin repeat domain-containing protein [Patescibacteria group bacterium]|nr:ankyrin repeat domain-containing protein [Patescibacteria group bacterium]
MVSSAFNNAAPPANDNARDPDMDLLDATENGSIGGVRDALARGANIDARQTNNDTALIIAAREGHIEVAKLLIEKGADTALVNNQNQTALMAALRGERSEEMNLLLIAAKTPVNTPDFRGYTAAFFAAQDNLAATMAAIAGAGGDLTIPNRDGVTPLIWATQLPNHDDVIAEIIKHACAIDAQGPNERTALMEAAFKKDAKLVEAFVALHANVMLRDADGKTAKDLAADSGATEIVKKLEAAEAARYAPLTGGVAGSVAAPRTAKFKPKTL